MTSVSCVPGIGISSGASDSIPFLLPLWARHQGAIPCGKGVPAAPPRLRGFVANWETTQNNGAHSQQAKATVQRRHEQIRKQLSAKKLEKGTIFYLKEKKVPKQLVEGEVGIQVRPVIPFTPHIPKFFGNKLSRWCHQDLGPIFSFNHLTVCKGREGETMTHNNRMEPHIITS